MHRAVLFSASAGVLAACSTPNVPTPSLAPRAAESIDPRLQPKVTPVPDRPVDAALAGRLAALVAQATNGDAAFAAAANRAEALVAVAGPPQSESWIAAQLALSQAVAARAPTAGALGDVDWIAADAIAAKGTIAAADFAAIRSAAEWIAEMDRRQAARLEAIQKRLGS